MAKNRIDLKEALKKGEKDKKEINALGREKDILEKKLECLNKRIEENKIEFYKAQMERVFTKSKLDRIFNRIFKISGIYNHFDNLPQNE